MRRGAEWDDDALTFCISPALFKKTTVIEEEEPNIKGINIDLRASGGLGAYKASLAVDLSNGFNGLSDQEKVALAAAAARRYQMINIKLDKTGGLTEALDLARLAREWGIGLMVGKMVGTSLAMAPAFVVAQLCRFADLVGALFLNRDRDHPMRCVGGVLAPPGRALWG